MRRLLPVLLLLAATGCATFVTGSGPDQRVRIESRPGGADVWLNSEHRGQTPLELRVSRREPHHVLITREGYRPYERHLGTGRNWWMLGNLGFGIIGGAVGVAVDLISGASHTVDPRNINVRLVPVDVPRDSQLAGEHADELEQPQEEDPP